MSCGNSHRRVCHAFADKNQADGKQTRGSQPDTKHAEDSEKSHDRRTYTGTPGARRSIIAN